MIAGYVVSNERDIIPCGFEKNCGVPTSCVYPDLSAIRLWFLELYNVFLPSSFVSSPPSICNTGYDFYTTMGTPGKL
jgi:hypothetical protein